MLLSETSLAMLRHAIEDVVERIPNAELVVGLQRYTHVQPHERRYRQLAMRGCRISLCGIPDNEPLGIPGVSYVPLSPDWPIAGEWFVIAHSPSFSLALLARETRGEAEALPRIEAMITADSMSIDLIGRHLSGWLQIEHRPLPFLAADEAQRNLALVLQSLLFRQEQQLALTLEESQHFAALRNNLSAQSRELKALTALVPRFSQHSSWQNLLLAHIQRAADHLALSAR